MINTTLRKYISPLAMIFILGGLIYFIPSCGGGGGGSSSPGSAPVISSLSWWPQSAYYMEGGGAVDVKFDLLFRDSDGDIKILRVTDSDGNSLTHDISTTIGSFTSGLLTFYISADTTIIETFTFQIWLIDSRGNASNQLSGSFTVSPLYSNATLTGVWMAKATIGPDTIIDSFRFDGNGHMVDSYILNPGTLPSPYNVQADGSFTYDMTFAYDPTITVTGKFTSATAATISSMVSGTNYSGTLRKVTDLGACQGPWNGMLTGGFSRSFSIDVDNTGTITGGSGFTGPLGGKLFCESGDATGLLTTGEANELNRIQFHSGTVVSGATVTISGNYETNGPGGTYTLVK